MKVLVADDDVESRRIVEIFLQKLGYEVVVVSDGAQALSLLQHESAHCLAILDWMMPGMDGPQVCREVRKSRTEPYVYILLLTAMSEAQDVVRGMEAGADDYVTKPFKPEELKARLRAGVRILELQEQLIAARESFRFHATHDPLTGLWNRTAVLAALRRELVRARRKKTAVGIILADVDHFKQINDTWGHLMGDAVLKETARRMSAAVREYDAVGRYGGEEFLIVVPGSDGLGTVNLGERIRAAISERPVEREGIKTSVTVSFGITASDPANEVGVESLLQWADSALYRAKNNGRNRVELAAFPELANSR
ncbi:MAG: diguanylate cyclase [Acidobacteria bacterium]|nr:diguanylate cyclase [Acidobacteriota bacterium]